MIADNPRGVMPADLPSRSPNRPVPPPIPHGSESLEVWDVSRSPAPWTLIGTIIRKGGRDQPIVCTPPDLDCLLNRPALLGYDPMDHLTGWLNGYISYWAKGTAPGSPGTTVT